MFGFEGTENANMGFAGAGWGTWGGAEGGEPTGHGPWEEWRGPRGPFGRGPGGRGPWGRGRFGGRGPFGRGPWGRAPWDGEFGPGGGPGFRGFGFWRFGPGGPRFGPGFGPWSGRGFGPGFGPGGPGGFGPGGPGRGPRRGPGPRMFGRGDLKYALLGLLQERPKHGYEMIKDLEDRAGGFYSPSPGAVYPTLQLLEDRGWVSVESVEGKKVYTITDAGRNALNEQHERFGEQGPFGWHGPHGEHEHEHHHEHGHREHEHHHEPHGPGFGPFGRGHGPFGRMDRETAQQLRELARQSRETMFMMRRAVLASGGDPERLARLRAIVERTRSELDDFVDQMPGESASGTPTTDGQGNEII